MDEIVGDCLPGPAHDHRVEMKFLGSYPVPGGTPSGARARSRPSGGSPTTGWPRGERPCKRSMSRLRLAQQVPGGMAERTIATVLKTVG